MEDHIKGIKEIARVILNIIIFILTLEFCKIMFDVLINVTSETLEIPEITSETEAVLVVGWVIAVFLAWIVAKKIDKSKLWTLLFRN
jgi:TRAP-type C4-dicarboxylate transport system permease small subunit